MEDYRSLTLDEVAALERQGCTAEDWSTIYVAEDFLADTVTDTHFYGEIKLGVYEQRMELEEGFSLPTGIRHATLKDVTIGDNCLIEGVGCYIHRYDIGDECYISNVGKLSCAPDATFGQGNTIAVLNEGGEENITLYAGLSPQVAALMALYADDRLARESLRRIALRQIAQEKRERGQIGHRSKIVSATEITNAIIGEDVEIYGVSRLAECTILSTPESSTYLGHDVIVDNSIVQAGTSVLDGAKISNSLVGEACHVGKDASLESTLLFANSYIDNGETCAAFCGPFTVSHHKSSLLIGGMYSFYNAGSGTNYSNHAYKMGPIHWGTLHRGCKTASGAHVAWPATIGAFSMCMGKILTHPNVEDLPFSYLFGMGYRSRPQPLHRGNLSRHSQMAQARHASPPWRQRHHRLRLALPLGNESVRQGQEDTRDPAQGGGRERGQLSLSRMCHQEQCPATGHQVLRHGHPPFPWASIGQRAHRLAWQHRGNGRLD